MRKRIVALVLCIAMAACCAGVLVACSDKDANPPSQFYYDNSPSTTEGKTQIVYLGDSIAEGILGASPLALRHEYAYPNIIGRRNDYAYYNHSVSGHLTRDLLAILANDVDYDGARMLISHVMTADVIHISIVGNDVLQDRPDLGENVTMHQVIVEAGQGKTDTIDKILFEGDASKNVASSKDNVKAIVERLRKLNPDAVIIFQKVYNPITILDTQLIKEDTRRALEAMPEYSDGLTLEDLHALGDTLISRLNSVFDEVFAEFEAEGIENAFYTVDGQAAFNAIYDADKERAARLIYPDGIHPANEGHAVLADLTQELLEHLELADGNAALAEYKNMRKNALNTYFASSVNNVAEVCAQIDAAQSCAEVTEIFFDATAGKTAANY